MENEGGDGPDEEKVEDTGHAHYQGRYPWSDEESSRTDRLQKILEEAEARLRDQQPLPSQSPSSAHFENSTEDMGNHKKALEEDSRWDYLLRMQNTLNESFNNAAWMHPHGLSNHDQCVIPECRHKGLEHFKMSVRRLNYIYLHQHPELDALMSVFVKRLLKAQPRDAVKFATEFFTFRRMAPDDLERLVNDELLKLKQYRSPKGWKKSHAPHFDGSDELELKDVNEVKVLSMGPTAQPFGFTPPPTPEKHHNVRIKKLKPKKHVYCGCKDPDRKGKVNSSQPEPKMLYQKREDCYGPPTH